MGRGLGTVQLEILDEVDQLPIEAWPRGIPVTLLALRLRCSDRQIRRAVHSLAERGLVTLVKTSRPGRQGQTLEVWDPRFREAWENFIDPTRRDAHITARIEIQRREHYALKDAKEAARRKKVRSIDKGSAIDRSIDSAIDR